MKRILITGTDGSNFQILALNLLLYSLQKNNDNFPKKWIVLIFHSKSISKSNLKVLRFNKCCELIPVMHKKTKDRYYIKLMLKNFIDEFKSKSSVILYLDYDHFCRNPLVLPKTYKDCIYVSSETKSLSLIEEIKPKNFSEFSVLNDTHYNNSFLYGNSLSLSRAMEDWKYFYKKYSGIITYRHLEEIAFSLSAKHQGFKLLPVPSELQSNFHEHAENCSLFHYGGDYWLSKFMKDTLNSAYRSKKQKFILENENISSELFNFINEFFQLLNEYL